MLYQTFDAGRHDTDTTRPLIPLISRLNTYEGTYAHRTWRSDTGWHDTQHELVKNFISEFGFWFGWSNTSGFLVAVHNGQKKSRLWFFIVLQI